MPLLHTCQRHSSSPSNRNAATAKSPSPALTAAQSPHVKPAKMTPVVAVGSPSSGLDVLLFVETGAVETRAASLKASSSVVPAWTSVRAGGGGCVGPAQPRKSCADEAVRVGTETDLIVRKMTGLQVLPRIIWCTVRYVEVHKQNRGGSSTYSISY